MSRPPSNHPYNNATYSTGSTNEPSSLTGSTSHGHGQQTTPVTWRLESTTNHHHLAAATSHGGASIPVTWNMEPNYMTQSSNHYPLHSQIHPPMYSGQQQQQLYQSSEVYSNVHGVHVNHFNPPTMMSQYQPHGSQQYSIAIPPPPPPPPPPLPRPLEEADQMKKRQSVSSENNSTQKNAESFKSQSESKISPEATKKKRQREKSNSEQQHQQNSSKVSRWQPPTNTEKKLAWQPPSKKNNHKQPVKSESAVKFIPPSKQNAVAHSITQSVDANLSAMNALSALETRWKAPSSSGSSGNQTKKSIAPVATAATHQPVDNSTALPTHQPTSQSTAPVATAIHQSADKSRQPTNLSGKAARRRRQRANKRARAAAANNELNRNPMNTSNTSAAGSSTNQSNQAASSSITNQLKNPSNVVDLIGEWINMEDSTSSIKKDNANSKSFNEESTREVIDLTGDDEFPPLASGCQEKEVASKKIDGKSRDGAVANDCDVKMNISKKQPASYAAVLSHPRDENKPTLLQKSESAAEGVDISNATSDNLAREPSSTSQKKIDKSKDAVANYSDLALEQMSQHQLASYAAALSHAIGESNTALRNDGLSQRDLAEKDMNSSKSSVQNDILFKSDSADDEMDISDEDTEEETKEFTAHETSSNASNTDSNQSLLLDSTATQSIEEKASKSAEETEKYRLRLEELRAKAKLANAKLRLAKKKQAMKSDDVISIEPPPDKPSSETDSINDLDNKEQSAMRVLRPLSDSIASDLTAVRMIGNLVVKVNLLTGPRDKVRYVQSVYDDSSSDDGSVSSSGDPPREEVKPLTSDVDPSMKASESLKQKLHLAKLRLEQKKKELALKKKQSAAPMNVENINSSEAAPVVEQSISTQKPAQENNENDAFTNHQASNLNQEDQTEPSDTADPNSDTPCAPTLEKQKAAQIEELKRRQQELKQSNEVSNLRNLVQRQREILRVKGKKLTDSSAQLQSCANDIKTKQQQLAQSEKRLEEMTHRKRIMEGMILRATDKLMTARRNLHEKQNH